MKYAALVFGLLVAGVCAQEPVIHKSKVDMRILVADVLRDFQGLCFGSTTFRFYTENSTWNLAPFCGNATCIRNETGLYEKVEDCGPIAKDNEQCQIIYPDPQAAFPNCCPTYSCAPGVTLEFPTPEEVRAQVEEARAAQEALALEVGSGPQPPPAPVA